MNTMKSKMVSAFYVSPKSECSELFVEGMLCQSLTGTSKFLGTCYVFIGKV